MHRRACSTFRSDRARPPNAASGARDSRGGAYFFTDRVFTHTDALIVIRFPAETIGIPDDRRGSAEPLTGLADPWETVP